MTHVIIVEDDPMVAQINRQYLEQFDDFSVDCVSRNGQDAMEYLRAQPIDLVILDVYMPNITGIQLLRQMRAEGTPSAVIMITAATEMSVVEEALRLGIVDYLIKPFSFPRFQEAIQKYLNKVSLIASSEQADQTVVDRLLGSEFPQAQDSSELRKGLHQKTMSAIYEYLWEHPGEKHTCESISQAVGLSKVTIRRYLNYLIETGRVLSSVDYETGGRPRVLYHLR
ncbi:CriR family two-component response regulator [Oscillibacter valericigenes Sjm18-20]|nr:CriR family two-component response regulator [Oscillibacter valericigenes Sjm18-20]